MIVNGARVDVEASPDMPLLWALRDILKLKGTKFGCGAGLCGACTVHLDGQPVRACQVSVGEVEGSITTIEGADGPIAAAVRQAWRDHQALQCGYCQPGQIMSAIALLDQIPDPTPDEIDAAMDGNLCRCGSYPRIRAAIRQAAKALADS